MNTGSGSVYQANLGIGYQITKRLDLIGTIGKMKAVNGDFDANVYGLSLGYRFDLLSATK